MMQLARRHFTFTAGFLILVSALLFTRPDSILALEVHQDIQGPFNSPADVTRTCIRCHRELGVQMLRTTHWTWAESSDGGQKEAGTGKKNSLAGFGISPSTNPERCMTCHISNTRPKVNFDLPAPEQVDCLPCHDATGISRAFIRNPAGLQPEDLLQMARTVTRPTTANCLTCHFQDCGLQQEHSPGSGARMDHQGDIHLQVPGSSFTCVNCHKLDSGHSRITAMAQTIPPHRKGCSSCHSGELHSNGLLNKHSRTVSCQTCHIPAYAVETPSIISWNWLMAGRGESLYGSSSSGRTYIRDANGFSFATGLEPVYLWDDGSSQVYSRGERVRPDETTYLQKPQSRKPGSKITPFRVISSTQFYDKKYRYLISPRLEPEGNKLFPLSADGWEKMAREGMEAIVLPFSGQLSTTTTMLYRRINHGVQQSGNALDCLDCHGSSSRMPWEMLGYDEDPWTSEKTLPVLQEGLGGETLKKTLSEPDPVNESVIPPGPAR